MVRLNKTKLNSIKRVIRIALPMFLILFIAHSVFRDWDQLRQSITMESLVWSVPAFICFFLSVMTIALNWKSLLGVLGVTYPFYGCMKTFFYSMLVKYIPGKIWGVTGRIVFARRDGVPEGTNALSIILESLFLMLSASLVGLPALGRFYQMPAEIRIILLLSPFVLIFLHPAMIRWGVKTMSRRFPAYVIHPESLPGYATMMKLLARYSLVWVFQGLGFWFSLRMLQPLSWRFTFIAITGNCLAWLVGFLAVFTPAGLGVREFVLARFTSGVIGAGPAAMAAILSRVLIVMCELVLAGVFTLHAVVGKKQKKESKRH